MKKIVLLACVALALGCKKTGTTETPLPQIAINTPVVNQHYAMGDTIRVTGIATYTNDLTEVAIHMTNMTTNFEFFHNHFSNVNTKSYNFESKYGIPDLTKATYKIEVEATDKDGNFTVKEVMVTIN